LIVGGKGRGIRLCLFCLFPSVIITAKVTLLLQIPELVSFENLASMQIANSNQQDESWALILFSYRSLSEEPHLDIQALIVPQAPFPLICTKRAEPDEPAFQY